MFIRADGGLSVGLGHVIRCLALAESLRSRGVKVTFVTRTTDSSVLKKIKRAGCNIYPVPAHISQKGDVRLLLRRAMAVRAMAVVTDSYELNQNYHQSIQDSGLVHLAITDFPGTCAGADILLNQNLWAKESDPGARMHSRLLLGCKYALLRSCFERARRHRKRRAEIPRVIILMGGSDPKCSALRALKTLDGIPAEFAIDVVAGISYRGVAELAAACKKAKHRAFLHHDPSNIAGIMNQATLAVSGAGSTCWELACLGIPMLLLALSDDQKRVASALDAQGAARFLGAGLPFPSRELARQVEILLADKECLRRMAALGRRLVDGGGARRVAEALIRAGVSRGRHQNSMILT